jgi:hypothetical protein
MEELLLHVTLNLLHVSRQADLRPLRKPVKMPSPGGIPPDPLSPTGQAEARNFTCNFTPLLLIGPFIQQTAGLLGSGWLIGMT